MDDWLTNLKNIYVEDNIIIIHIHQPHNVRVCNV